MRSKRCAVQNQGITLTNKKACLAFPNALKIHCNQQHLHFSENSLLRKQHVFQFLYPKVSWHTLWVHADVRKITRFKINFMFIFQLIAMKSIANASHNRSLSEFQQVVLCIKHSYCRCNYCKCFYAGLKLIFKTDAGHVDKPKKFCQRSFAIYMGKPVGSRFGQMVIKSQGC